MWLCAFEEYNRQSENTRRVAEKVGRNAELPNCDVLPD